MFFQWFHNASEVQKAAYKLKQMLELHDNNPDENTCYLIKLDFEDITKPATELSILEKAKDLYKLIHGLWTPNEGINQKYLKNWADVADKICFGRT